MRRELLLVSWFGERDGIRHGTTSLLEEGWTIYTYCHFVEKLEAEEFSLLVKKYDVTCVMFWCFAQITPEFVSYSRILNPNVTFVLYNWDDPYSLRENSHRQLFKELDCAFTCSTEAQSVYASMGIDSTFLLPGCPVVNELYSQKYECDVCFIIGNLYENIEVFPDQVISRTTLLNILSEMKDITVHLYGPKELHERFPSVVYKGVARYGEIDQISKTSFINISTHVCESSFYLNERDVLILGSGGFLLTDSSINAAGLPRSTHEVLEKNDIPKQIRRLISQKHHVQQCRENGFAFAQSQLSYKSWARTIDRTLRSHIQRKNIY